MRRQATSRWELEAAERQREQRELLLALVGGIAIALIFCGFLILLFGAA